ncbi:MAG: SWIM zinc finger family protein, partial [Nannocystaceae bacterium]|nr:SWIM zinc finger family protein [Nannocystaceae bacterium]
MSPTIHATELADEFSARTWARGRRYFETGRVRDVSGDASGWEAQVQGTRRSPYSVWIVVVEEDGQAWLDGACSCPLTILCKHMAALLLAARAAHRDGAGTDPSEPERGPSLTEAADLREWVAQLERVRESPPTRPVTGASPAAQLIYVLLLQGPGRATVSDLMVETWTARRLKRGGLGKCRRYTLGDAFGVSSRTPAYVTNADRLLWFRLTQLGGAYSAFSRDSEGTALFRDLVATGRCYFANAKGLALRYGSARSARVVWELDGTGRQRARVHTAESRVEVVLPLD